MNLRECQTLLTILAKSDACFWPIRKHDVPGRVLFCERRRAFLTAGVPWASGGRSEADRKTVQRALEGLAAAGLVKVYNPRGARTLGVRLTEAADDLVRRRIGLATFADSLPFLDELYRRRDDDEGFDGLGAGCPNGVPWTSEQALTGVAWGDNENRGHYVLLTHDMYPLLWRGFVRSGSSIQGHTWYAPTAAGYELARQRAEAGQASAYPPPLPAVGDEADFDFYRLVRRAEVKAIECGEPKDRNDLGDIPLPVCPILRRFLTASRADPNKEGAR